MQSKYEKLQKLVGVRTVTEDLITSTQLQRLNATLNRRDPLSEEGDPVPWGWHCIFFPGLAPTESLVSDGTASEFEEPADSPLPRRMFAGNRFSFHEPLRVGDRAIKEMWIKSVQLKEGRSGALLFVTYDVRIAGPRGLVLEDEQNLVYREPSPRSAHEPAKTVPVPRTDAPWRRSVSVNPVTLFRFSACCFNPHRIHYDHPYTTVIENYPGLVVQGPLTSVLLLELLREHMTEKALKLSGWVMRARAPLFVNRPFTLLGEPSADGAGCELWAVDEAGGIAMEISIRYRN